MSEVKSIDDLFGELIELRNPAERQEFLDGIGGEDPRLRDQLQRLLGAHAGAGSFLADGGQSTVQFEGTENIGKQIGQYKLRELIGEGGMGAVYVAEQEEPLRRKVALKVIKPGMDSKTVLARFDAERNALALMNHPNIAKVLDAGATPEGRPFFVMELVNGIPITEYCDQQKLTIRDRLDLFIQVCQAIQHAHQKAIIHRDVKPSNVLVTELDGKPVAKVIDFGVAKALNQSLTEYSVYTAFQTVIGTPLYMSPEQASFSAVDVDTRSDVYSLGVLLYELLTGTTPFTSNDLKHAAQEEVFRLIREQEPPRPSNRVSGLGNTAMQISQLRRTQPDQLGQTIKGDLDWIVMKALSKERSRRYKTSDALSEDVLHHLKDEAIEARPDSTIYRMRRIYRRNRKAVLACAAAMVLAFSAFVVIVRQASSLRNTVEQLETANNEANELLISNRTLVIQRALMKAFEGDIDAVGQIVTESNRVFGDNEWPTILNGAAHMHAGRYGEAQEILRGLLKTDLENVIPARAMLSVAYMYDGDWDNGIIFANKIRDASPRTGEFADLDRLFLGYALVFVETQSAVDLLTETLNRNPTWLAGHTILADAMIHLGKFSDDDSLIDAAFRKSNAIIELFNENPFALDVSLFAHRASIEIRQAGNQPWDHLVEPANKLVTHLNKYNNFILAQAMPAQYFDVIGEFEQSEVYWREVLTKGRQMWRWAALGRLYWTRSSQEMLTEVAALDGIENQPWVLAAKAYFLSDISDGRDQALSLFNEMVRRPHASMSDRYYAIHIPLLVGEKELAISTAERWVSDWRDGEFSEWPDHELMKIIATDGQYSPKSKTRLVRVMSSHMRGLLALADGRTDEALVNFVEASQKPWVNIDHYWGQAFARRLQNDLNWPSQNTALHSDNSISNIDD